MTLRRTVLGGSGGSGVASTVALNLARLKGTDRIRQMAALPPDAPPLMVVPPTITQDTTVGSGLTATYTEGHLRWAGPLSATPTVAGAMQQRGNANAAGAFFTNSGSAQVAFDFDGQKFDLNLRANASLRYRIWVNERVATADLVALPSGTNANAFLHVDLGSASRGNPRHIVVEFEDTTAISVFSVRAAPTDLFGPPAIPSPRVLLVGDSYGRGQGAARTTYGYARSLGRMMGWADCWSAHCSYPGTGLVHANDATIGPYIARIGYDVLPYAPDLVIVQGSINDTPHLGDIGPALVTYVGTLRAAHPNVAVVATSPLFVATPSADHLAVNAEMKAAAATLGIPYVDALVPAVFTGTGAVGSTDGSGNADWARTSDFTHPTTAGAYALARHVSGLLGQVLGAPAGETIDPATVAPVVQPPLPAATYFFPLSASAVTQNSAPGNNTLRVAPWRVERPITLARIGAEVTTVGEAGSKYRLVIYADNGSGNPGALVVDAGQINGDSATVQELAINVTLQPGIYWIGGVAQSAPTTQPTIRFITAQTSPLIFGVGASLPAAGVLAFGFAATVPGAAPATFTATGTASSAPRLILRTA